MADDQAGKKRDLDLRDVWRLLLVIVGVAAVIRELGKTAEERDWHGKVAEFVPYDFRMPTADRFRQAYWNPDGPPLGPKPWGVGWALNAGAIKRYFE